MRKIPSIALSVLILLSASACASPFEAKPEPKNITVMSSLGDSITQAMDSCGEYANCPEYSWSTGSDPKVDSHLQRIEKVLGKEVTAYNNSVSGSKADDLPRQASLAVQQNAQYVTILTGANDACSPTVETMTSEENFRASITNALTTISSASLETDILVASVPSLNKLWNAGKNNMQATMVWNYGNICQSMLANAKDDSEASDNRRAAVEERIEAYNTILEQTCSTIPNCHFDERAVFKSNVSTEDLSPLDWFHPSVQGQNKIASETWNQVSEAILYN